MAEDAGDRNNVAVNRREDFQSVRPTIAKEYLYGGGKIIVVSQDSSLFRKVETIPLLTSPKLLGYLRWLSLQRERKVT